MKRFGIALLVILTIQGISFGQSSKLRMADSYFGKLSYAYAAPLYAELIGTPEENTSVKHKLAICHYHMGDMQNAEKYFLEIINSDAVGVDDYFMLSQALKQNGKTKESDLWMGNLNVKYPNDHRGLSYSNNRGYQENIVKNSIHFGISHLSINTPYTEFGAYQIYGKDEVIVISNRGFSNAVKQDWTWNDSPFLDMYVSNQIKKDSLSTPVVKKGKSNTRFHEGPLSFSPDGKKVYFTRNNISEKKMRRDANGIQNLKIYEADVSEKGEWLNEREIALNSKDFSVGHPTLSSDGKTMFFASDMPGGFGGADIYSVSLNADGTFGKPVNLGSEINTEGNEMFPCIGSDGYLYFASNGLIGLGGLDVFVAFPSKSGSFRKATNAGNKINSVNDDFALIFNKDGKSGYFSSNRLTGNGEDDIYSFTLLLPYKNGVFIEGIIADQHSGQILPETKVVIKDQSGNIVAELTTDAEGKYTAELEEDKTYTVSVARANYFEAARSIDPSKADPSTGVVNGDVSIEKQPDVMLLCLISDALSDKPLEGVKVKITEKAAASELVASTTDGTGTLKKEVIGKNSGDAVTYTITLEKEGYLGKTAVFTGAVPANGVINLNEKLDLSLDKIAVGADLATIIDINPIYFDLGKADIRKDAAKELDKIVKVMNDNPKMVIELGSHTDCRSSYKFNIDLSSRRAIASANYIKKRITKPERIYGRGYGESKLKVDCPCEGAVKSNCSEEEHQKNRRTEFVIIKM
jgi:outer membrane protein OmpA-like peptidoglycan-associated protein/tetratricopeptide (TPR) repeat protein